MKLIQTIKGFSNIAEYKISIQKSIVFIYINNQIKCIMEKTTPFMLTIEKR